MDFHLTVINCVGSVSTLVNGCFVILILISPPDNLGIFRSQYYVGAFTSFFFAATQLWTANLFYPNGTMFLLFSARKSGTFAFLLFLGAVNLQFIMLSCNFAARYAAVRGGRMLYYLSKKARVYSVIGFGIVTTYIPPIFFLSPTAELRNITHAMYSKMFEFDFMNDYFFVNTYENLTSKEIFFNHTIYISVICFQGAIFASMIVCGIATYLHISKHTQSRKLKEMNNRLLRSRSFQAFFSFIFLFLPGGLVINICMLLRVDASSISPILSSMMSFGTLFNPFIDIALSPDYRKRFMVSMQNKIIGER